MALSTPPKLLGTLDHIMLIREGQNVLENMADLENRKPYGAYIYRHNPIQEIEDASR